MLYVDITYYYIYIYVSCVCIYVCMNKIKRNNIHIYIYTHICMYTCMYYHNHNNNNNDNRLEFLNSCWRTGTRATRVISARVNLRPPLLSYMTSITHYMILHYIHIYMYIYIYICVYIIKANTCIQTNMQYMQHMQHMHRITWSSSGFCMQSCVQKSRHV